MANEKEVQGLQDIVNCLAGYKFNIRTALKLLTIALVHVARSAHSKEAIQHAKAEIQMALDILTRETAN